MSSYIDQYESVPFKPMLWAVLFLLLIALMFEIFTQSSVDNIKSNGYTNLDKVEKAEEWPFIYGDAAEEIPID